MSTPSDLGLPAGATILRDLPYVTNGHARQTLDLYLPAGGQDLPLLVYIHGGAFRVGSKAAGVPVTFYTVAGGGHGGFTDPKVDELTRDFLANYL